MSFVRPYIEQRLLEHRTTGLVLLNTVHRVATQLAIEDGDPAKFQEYAPKLLQLSSSVAKKEVCQLLLPGPGYWLLEGFNYELLTAAAYINNISIVKRLVGSCLGWKAGILGDPFHAALAGRHFDILNLLCKSYYSMGLRNQHRLLQRAAEYGDKEMVEFILRGPNWSPFNYFANAPTPTTNIEIALRTPNVEIFNIIMQERGKIAQDPLTPDTLEKRLHLAVIRGWVDMARHIISLGETSGLLGRFRLETELYHACKAGQSEIVKLLLAHMHMKGAKAEAAASYDQAGTHKSLLEHHPDGKNCVAVAAGKGLLGIVRMLLDAGINPDGGSTAPMVQAVRAEHPGICQLLIEQGATMTVPQAVVEAARREEPPNTAQVNQTGV